MPRPIGPYDNPFRAAEACAKEYGVSRDRLARALLSCTRFDDWSPDNEGGLDDMLGCIADRVGIIVQRTEHKTFVAYFDHDFQPKEN